MWYSERNVYLETGRWLSGATYLRQQGGPHPRPLEPMLQELEAGGVIARRIADRSDDFDLLFAVRRPDLSHFRPEEISIVEAVIRVICLEARGVIANQKAHDQVWQIARIGEPLPYYSVFAGRPGEILPTDIEWAMRVVRSPVNNESSDTDGELADQASLKIADSLKLEAIEAILWNLNHDPTIGVSLPVSEASWFIYKQAQHQRLAVPEVVVVYRFEVEELLLESLRIGGVGEEDDEL
ncbi:MAG: hypothetical protein R3D25_18595 [Geminicoccaceae bacterium]